MGVKTFASGVEVPQRGGRSWSVAYSTPKSYVNYCRMNLGQNDVVELLQEGIFKLKLMTPQASTGYWRQ